MAGTASDISFWTGAVDTNWNTAGNWGTDAGTPTIPPNSATANGERVRFDHRATRDVVTSSSGAANLNRIEVSAGCRRSIDLGSNVSCTSGTAPKIEYAGTGDQLTIAASATTVNVSSTSGGKVVISGGTTTTLNALGGRVEVGGSAVVTNADVSSASVVFNANGTAITALGVHAGGRVELYRSATTMTVNGVYTGGNPTQVVCYNSIAATTLNNNGGLIDWKSNGTIGTFNGKAGLLRTSSNPWTGFTITTFNNLNTSSRVQKIWSGGTITISTDNSVGPDAGFGDGSSLPIA